MKNSGVMLALWFSICGSWAQVTVEVQTEQTEFISKEAIPVAVRIINHSGQTLHLGGEADWLTFSIESRDGFLVSQSGPVPVLGGFELPSSKVATKRVEISPYFELSRAGQYSLTATVKIRDWPAAVSSEPKRFEIVHGTRVWEQEFGVPHSAAPGQPPEVRKYILQSVTYAKQMKLYLRVANQAETDTLKVVSIGPMVSFSRYDTLLDRACNLHLAYQCGSRIYNYSVVTPDGEVILRESHLVTANRPHLKIDDDGKVTLTGGQRKITADDLPRPVAQAASNDINQAPRP